MNKIGFFILLAAIFIGFWSKYSSQDHYELIVGVLSARDHFKQREIIREGVSRQTNDSCVLLRFVVSERACHVPLVDRVDEYTCTALRPQPKDRVFISHVVKAVNTSTLTFTGTFGLDFLVHRAIVVQELGVFDHLADGIKNLLKERIVSQSFVAFGGGTLNGSYRYKPIQHVVLPKGFYGSIVVDAVSENDPVLLNHECDTDDAGGAVHYKQVYRSDWVRHEFPRFVNNYVNTPCYVTGAAFAFQMNESANDELRAERFSRHTRHLAIESARLAREASVHRDIVFVDTVEVYRSLPNKLMRFYDWLSGIHYDFFMKTDDDCFIHIPRIRRMLHERLTEPTSNIILGSFREYFPVERHGKWAEHAYHSLTYPPFPCGSGYILSRDVIQWLSLNKQRLKVLQGEDVSMGVWLSALRVGYLHERRFCCSQCQLADLLTSPDNSIKELRRLYELNETIT